MFTQPSTIEVDLKPRCHYYYSRDIIPLCTNLLPPCIGFTQFSEELTFDSENSMLCRPFSVVDDSAVGNDVNLVIELSSNDTAVSQLDTAAFVIRDDDSKIVKISIPYLSTGNNSVA